MNLQLELKISLNDVQVPVPCRPPAPVADRPALPGHCYWAVTFVVLLEKQGSGHERTGQRPACRADNKGCLSHQRTDARQRGQGPPDRRGGPADQLGAAQLRQAALPRRLPARPDPPPPGPRRGVGQARRRILRAAARVLRDLRRWRGHRARRPDPGRGRQGPGRDGRLRDEDLPQPTAASDSPTSTTTAP